jgi:hypothetical protein
LNTLTWGKQEEQISQNIATKSKQDERKWSGCLIATETNGSHLVQQVYSVNNNNKQHDIHEFF